PAFNVAGLVQAPPEAGQPGGGVGLGRREVQIPNHWDCRLLRARRERPRGCATEQRDELAPLHSITSSARSHSGRPPNMNTTPAQLEVPRPTPPRYLV